MSKKVPMYVATEIIEASAFKFMDKISNWEVSSSIILTEELSSGLFNVLSMIGVSQQLELKAEESEEIEGEQSLSERSTKFVGTFNNFTDKYIDNLDPFTECENQDTDVFTFKGGKMPSDQLGGKYLGTNDSMSRIPNEFNLTQLTDLIPNQSDGEFPLIKYKIASFAQNARLNISKYTMGPTLNFAFYSEKGRDELHLTNLSQLMQMDFMIESLTEANVEELECAYYNKSIGNYSKTGMKTLSKQMTENGNTNFKCAASHLSEYGMAIGPGEDSATDTKSIVMENNLQSVTQFGETKNINVLNSVPFWILVCITFITMILMTYFYIKYRRKQNRRIVNIVKEQEKNSKEEEKNSKEEEKNAQEVKMIADEEIGLKTPIREYIETNRRETQGELGSMRGWNTSKDGMNEIEVCAGNCKNIPTKEMSRQIQSMVPMVQNKKDIPIEISPTKILVHLRLPPIGVKSIVPKDYEEEKEEEKKVEEEYIADREKCLIPQIEKEESSIEKGTEAKLRSLREWNTSKDDMNEIENFTENRVYIPTEEISVQTQSIVPLNQNNKDIHKKIDNRTIFVSIKPSTPPTIEEENDKEEETTNAKSIGIQIEDEMGIRRREKKAKGFWSSLFGAIKACHNLFKPFKEEEGGIPRHTKMLILHQELLIYIWISGVFFSASGEEMEDQITATGFIILGIVCILLAMPPMIIVLKLLTRPPIPQEFMSQLGEILTTKEEEYKAWNKKQIKYHIAGYIVAITLIAFFTIHILTMSVIMGYDLTILWMRALFVSFFFDYVLLQTSKGVLLICCVYEECVEFVFTFFAGAMF